MEFPYHRLPESETPPPSPSSSEPGAPEIPKEGGVELSALTKKVSSQPAPQANHAPPATNIAQSSPNALGREILALNHIHLTIASAQVKDSDDGKTHPDVNTVNKRVATEAESITKLLDDAFKNGATQPTPRKSETAPQLRERELLAAAEFYKKGVALGDAPAKQALHVIDYHRWSNLHKRTLQEDPSAFGQLAFYYYTYGNRVSEFRAPLGHHETPALVHINLLNRGIELGDAFSAFSLGVAMEHNRVPTAPGSTPAKMDQAKWKEAERMYELATKLGSVIAPRYLGNLYAREAKFSEAAQYYKLGIQRGDAEAEKLLKWVADNGIE